MTLAVLREITSTVRAQEVHSSGQQEPVWHSQQLLSLQPPWSWLCVSWRWQNLLQGWGSSGPAAGAGLSSAAWPEPLAPCWVCPGSTQSLSCLLGALTAADSSAWLNARIRWRLCKLLKPARGQLHYFLLAQRDWAGCCSSSAQDWLHQVWMAQDWCPLPPPRLQISLFLQVMLTALKVL